MIILAWLRFGEGILDLTSAQIDASVVQYKINLRMILISKIASVIIALYVKISDIPTNDWSKISPIYELDTRFVACF